MNTTRWKTLGILLGVLSVLAIAAIIIVPKLINLDNYRGLIAEQITKAVGGKAELGRIRWGLKKGIWVAVDGVTVKGASRLPGDIRIAGISGQIAAVPLLSKKVVVKHLQLESPDATILLKPTSEPAMPQRPEPPKYEPGDVKAPAALPFEIMIASLSIENGKFRIEDTKTRPGEKLARTFTDVTVVVKDLAPRQVTTYRATFRDAADVGFGKLDIQGTFSGLTEALTLENPELKIQATIPDLDVEIIKPYLQDNPWILALSGSVAVDISLTSDFGRDLQTQGFIDLCKTLFNDSVSGETLHPKAGTKIAYNVTLFENGLNIKDFDLFWANLSLKLEGAIGNLQSDPTIKNFGLTADLPLKELAHIIPWKKLGAHADPIQEVLAGGGSITIEKASIPNIRLAQLSDKPDALISDIQLTARFSGISGRPITKLPRIKDIEGMIRVENGVVNIENLTGTFGVTKLPAITARITEWPGSPKVQAQLTGAFEVGEAKDEETGKILKALGIERLSGAGNTDLSLQFAVKKPEDIQINGKFILNGFRIKTAFTSAVFEDFHLTTVINADAIEISDCKLKLAVPAVKDLPQGTFRLAMKGKMTDWRSRPKLALSHLNTSDISLPALVAIVPLDAFGQHADRIRTILLSSGTIAVEALTTPPIDLMTPPKDIDGLFKRSTAQIRVVDINIQPDPEIPGIEGITGKLSLQKGVLGADRIAARHGPIALPDLTVRATHLFKKPKIDASLKGHIRIGESPLPRFKGLLLSYGFKDVAGDADISLKARYDHAKPDQWTAEGRLSTKNLSAVSHPGGVMMKKLDSDLSFTRKNRFDIHIKKLSTEINDSPINLQGRLSIGKAGVFLIDIKSQAEELDLEQLVAVSPALKAMDWDLKGKINLDVGVYLASKKPAETRLTGTITTKDIGFHLKNAGFKIEALNSSLDLKGDTLHINSMTASVNDQVLSIQGQTTRPFIEPIAQLRLTAHELDLDKLFPPSRPPAQSEQRIEKKKIESERKDVEEKKLPPSYQRAVGQLQMEIAKLHFRGNTFENVNFTTDYQRGVLKPFDLKLSYAKSGIQAGGTMDFRNLNSIGFEINSDIRGLPLQSLKPIFALEKVPMRGPLFISGNIKGRTGTTLTLLSSINGKIEANVGRGTYLESSATVNLLSKILSVTKVQSILTGDLLRDVGSEGIPFDRIESAIDIVDGNLTISAFKFISSAMNMNVSGNVDLVKQNLDIDVVLEPFGIVDTALGLVPIAGKLGRKFTRYNVSVTGAIEHPNVQLGAVRKVTKTIKKNEKATEEKKSKGFLRGFF